MTHKKTAENIKELGDAIYAVVSANPRALSNLIDEYINQLGENDFSTEYETYIETK